MRMRQSIGDEQVREKKRYVRRSSVTLYLFTKAMEDGGQTLRVFPRAILPSTYQTRYVFAPRVTQPSTTVALHSSTHVGGKCVRTPNQISKNQNIFVLWRPRRHGR
jgi:hypothetical protein